MLTLKQRRFAYAMVQTGDLEGATKAAEITIELAQSWLNEPDIKAAIDHDKIAAVETAMETRERVIARYAAIANADIGDYFMPGTDCGSLVPLEHLTKTQRMCIKKIKPTKDGFELELYDRMRANDKLAELLGLIADGTGDVSAEDKARQIRYLLQEMENVTTGVTTH